MDNIITFKQFLEEGRNDPAIFKAVFLAGGPGSGKSFIVGKTGLKALGYKVVNSDDMFELKLSKAGLKPTPEDIGSDKGQALRKLAKITTNKKLDLHVQERLGLVIDGTGKDLDKIKKQAGQLKAIGYDVALILVNTDVNTALARNAKRERTLPDDIVTGNWKQVQNNIGAFQQLFGKNFLVVDNSDDNDVEKEVNRAYKSIVKFTKAPVKNHIAKKWMNNNG